MTTRRHFLTTIGLASAASLAPWPSAAQSPAARTPLYPPTDLSMFDRPIGGVQPFAMPLAYQAITWGGKDLQAIEEIGAGGFKGIQLRSPIFAEYGSKPAELKAILTKHKVSLVVLSSGNVNGDPKVEADEITRHMKHAQFVKDLGGLYLQVIDERPKGRAATPDDYKRMGALLTKLGTRCTDMGVTLVYHNHMNALGERPEEVDAVLAAADPRFVKLLLDIAHYTQSGGDPVKAVQAYHQRTAVIHLKDVISPLPGDTKEPMRSYRFVELGRGKVNITGVVQALRQVRFRGWGVIELDAVPDPARTPKECLAINKQYVEDTLKLKV